MVSIPRQNHPCNHNDEQDDFYENYCCHDHCVGTALCRGLAWQTFGIEKLAFFIIGNINIDLYRDEKEDGDDGDSAMMKGLPGLWW